MTQIILGAGYLFGVWGWLYFFWAAKEISFVRTKDGKIWIMRGAYNKIMLFFTPIWFVPVLPHIILKRVSKKILKVTYKPISV